MTIDVQTEYLVINDVNIASIAFFWLGKCKGYILEIKLSLQLRIAICTLYILYMKTHDLIILRN